MKILILSQLFYPDTIGGTDRYVYEQATRLAARGHEVSLVIPRLVNKPKFEEYKKIKIYRFGHPLLYKLTSQAFWIKFLAPRVIKKHYAEVVFAHHYFMAQAFCQLKSDLPFIYFFHASFSQEFLLERNQPKVAKYFKQIEDQVLERADKIVLLSDFSRQLVVKHYPQINLDKVVKIPGAADLEKFIPAKKKNNPPILVTARRLVPRMGLENLILAARKIKDDFLLLIIGEGPLKDQLQNQIKDLKLEQKIKLLGRLSDQDLIKQYQQADLFVLPTLAYEGFGLATLEALACDTPVMATPVGANSEILNKLDKKLLFKNNSPEAIAQGLDWFLTNRPVYQTRDFVEKNYSWNQVINQTEELIK